jgi:D-tyrosyl-tRNA(Tyr) deacylase
VTHSDSGLQAETLARKVYELRILDDEKSAADVGAPLLVVSQFTLYGDARKGRRPSWTAAAPAQVAEPFGRRLVASRRLNVA